MYNSDTDEDEETEPSSSGQQIIENSITMNKMKLLKAKMKNMNLSKKVKLLAFGQAYLSLTPAGHSAMRSVGHCENIIKYYSFQISGLSYLLNF